MSGPNDASTSTTENSSPTTGRLRIGTRLLQDAFGPDNVLLLRAGARIETQRELKRLSEPGVRFGPDRGDQIPFDMENEAALDAASASTDPRAREFIDKVSKAAALKSEAVRDITSVFERIAAGGEVDLERAKSAVSMLLRNMLEDPRALVSLAALKDADAYTYTHSVNVGIMAMHLAMRTEYRDDVEEIGLGALMHDTGKMKIPLGVLNKPGRLDEDDWVIMRQHPTYGWEQLQQAGETRESVLSCVLGHHEKVNGGGYPQGKRGGQITPFARLTAIADVYDALTTQRPYKTPMTSKEALTLMARKMEGELDRGLLECFISIVGFYPVGSEVELSDGSVGTVLNHYATSPNRPSVILHTDANGGEIPGSPVVDLNEHRGPTVTRFVDERRIQDIAREAVEAEARKAA